MNDHLYLICDENNNVAKVCGIKMFGLEVYYHLWETEKAKVARLEQEIAAANKKLTAMQLDIQKLLDRLDSAYTEIAEIKAGKQ